MSKEELIALYPSEPSTLYIWLFGGLSILLFLFWLSLFLSEYVLAELKHVIGLVCAISFLCFLFSMLNHDSKEIPNHKEAVQAWKNENLPTYARMLPNEEIKYLYADINFNKAKVSVDSCVEVKVLEVDSVMVSETNEDKLVKVRLEGLSKYGIPEDTDYYIFFGSTETLSTK